MSLSRKLLESLGLESDKVSTIIDAHTETVDSLKAQIETYKADAEKLTASQKKVEELEKELDTMKASGGDWQKKYEEEHQQYEEYKATIANNEAKNAKAKAFKELLKAANVSDKRLDAIMKVTNLDDYEMDGEAIKDADKVTETIQKEWADFIVSENTQGANTSFPPKNDQQKNLAELSIEEYIAARSK